LFANKPATLLIAFLRFRPPGTDRFENQWQSFPKNSFLCHCLWAYGTPSSSVARR